MKIAAVLLCLLITGCATEAVVDIAGAFDNKPEKFMGSVTVSALTDTGPIQIFTQRGAECKGVFKRNGSLSTGTGAGTFTCDDGRKGDFRYSYQGAQGQGFGKMDNGDLFSFGFGREYTAQQARSARALAEGFEAMGQGMSSPRTTTNCSNIAGMISCTSR